MTETKNDATETEAPPQNQLVKLLIEFGPLIAFFVAYKTYDIFWATATIVVATLISLGFSKVLYGKISTMPVVTAVVVTIFGGLTLWLNNPTFIYLKPTIVNLLFAGALIVGQLMGRPLIKMLLGEQLKLTDEGWNKFTMRWILFFVFVAGLNEFVWRTFSEDTWVTFKVFGILPLTLVFALMQVGLITRYTVED